MPVVIDMSLSKIGGHTDVDEPVFAVQIWLTCIPFHGCSPKGIKPWHCWKRVLVLVVAIRPALDIAQSFLRCLVEAVEVVIGQGSEVEQGQDDRFRGFGMRSSAFSGKKYLPGVSFPILFVYCLQLPANFSKPGTLPPLCDAKH